MSEEELIKKELNSCRELHEQWEKNHEKRSEDFRTLITGALIEIRNDIKEYCRATELRLRDLEKFKIESDTRIAVITGVAGCIWGLIFFIIERIWK